MVDRYGEAKIVTDLANDFPAVAVKGDESSQPVRSLGASYQYSIMELRRAARTGIPLDAELALAAREVIERKTDAIVANGDTATGMKGLIDQVTTSVSKGSQASGTTWDTATGLEILTDVLKLSRAVFDNTNGTFGTSQTLVVGTKGFSLLSNTLFSGTGFTNATLYNYILASSPWIKRIVWWNRLDTAGASSKERIIALSNDPRVASLVVPLPFEQTPPEPRNMAFVVNCHARVGGVKLRYVKAAAYMDGTQA
jgi:hypothetical protein